MLIVPRKRIWTQQPQYPAQIDWGNPITKDLAFVDNAATFANAKSVSRNGLCHMAGSLRQKTGITILGSSPTQSGLTLLSIGFLNGTLNGAERQYGIRFGEGNGNFFGIGLEAYAGNGSLTGQIAYSDYTSTGFTYLPHGVPTNGSPLILGITYARGAVGGLRALVNGKIFTTLDTSDKPIFPGTTEMEVHSASGATNNSGYLTTLNLFFKRTLSDEEIASLSANPWQIFRAPDSHIFVPTGAGIVTNLIALGVAVLSAYPNAVQFYGAGSLGASQVGCTGAQMQPSGVLSTASAGVGIAPKQVQALAALELAVTTVETTAHTVQYILGILDNLVQLGVATMAVQGRAIRYSVAGVTYVVVPKELMHLYTFNRVDKHVGVLRDGTVLLFV